MPDFESANVQAGVQASFVNAQASPTAKAATQGTETAEPTANAQDVVEISSEAIQASAVQEAPAVELEQPSSRRDRPQAEGADTLPTTQTQEQTDSAPVEQERPEIEVDLNSRSSENLSELSEKFEKNREARNKTQNSTRKTVFTSENGTTQIKVIRGDREIEIPPDEVVSTKVALRQRMEAFIAATNLDVEA